MTFHPHFLAAAVAAPREAVEYFFSVDEAKARESAPIDDVESLLLWPKFVVERRELAPVLVVKGAVDAGEVPSRLAGAAVRSTMLLGFEDAGLMLLDPLLDMLVSQSVGCSREEPIGVSVGDIGGER